MVLRVCTFAPILAVAAARVLAAGFEVAPSSGVGGANVEAVAATAVSGGESPPDETAPVAALPPEAARVPSATAQP